MITLSLMVSNLFISCNQKEAEKPLGAKHDEEYAAKINDGTIIDNEYIGSAQRSDTAVAGPLSIQVDYGSPGVRNRVIWGELVPYDSVWVTGANIATSVRISKDVKIYGKLLPAGRYAFFTIPGHKEWTLIFNKDYNQHNSESYDEKKDVLRFSVVPDTLHKQVHRLTYDLNKLDEHTIGFAMSWEYLRIAFKAKAADGR